MNVDMLECKDGNYKHLLAPDEYVLAECRPAKIPYILKTIKGSLPVLLAFGLFMCISGYLVFFDRENDGIKSFDGIIFMFMFSATLFFLAFSSIIKDIFNHKKVLYVITNKRLLTPEASPKSRVSTINYEDVPKATLKTSAIERSLNVGTISLFYSSRGSIDLVGIPNAHEVCAKINDFSDTGYVEPISVPEAESAPHNSEYGKGYDSSMFSQ